MKPFKMLKTGLYGIQIAVVFLLVMVVYIVFNLVINGYIARLAENNIAMRFARLDAYYHSSPYDGYYDGSSNFIIAVHHMVLDDAGALLYPREPRDSPEEWERAQEILSRQADGRLPLREGQGKKLKLGENSYYLMQRGYTGVYDGAFVLEKPTGRTYFVIAYIDITPIASFQRLLNRVLFLLMAGLFIMTSALLFSAGRGLDRSFQALKAYILQAGERKSLSRARRLPYEEFNEIADTVFQMSHMIGEAEAAQVKFFQNASHELRTPLTAIRGYAEGIAAGVIRDAKASAAVILEHSDKMSALVDELLYLSKLDICMETPETFDLRETAGRCIWSVTGKAESAGLRIDAHMGDQPAPLSGHEEMLERALSNILSNALRYARREILVSLTSAAGQTVISVTDDGDGISAEDLPHIFERFYKGRGGVSGIGLSIAQEAVQRHGGQIRVRSTPGETCFQIVLPCSHSAAI